MPPKLSLLLGIVFVWWLFHRDMRWRQLPSAALYIPGLCLIVFSSRPLSDWLAFALGGGRSSAVEGSPINVAFNGILFFSAFLVLQRRGFSWAEFLSANKALVAIFGFFVCSALWSPYPIPTLRMAIQNVGVVLSGLIILTEKDPAASLRIVFARVSYVLFPFSVVFLKYFPNIGRVVSGVSGHHFYCGVASHKNLLGQMTIVFCLILLWDLMETRNHGANPNGKSERWTRLISLGIGIYLLIISDCATAVFCFVVGVVLLFTSQRLARMKNIRQVIMVGALFVLCGLALETVFGISDGILMALGRDPSLTGRTDIWRLTLEKNTADLIGSGLSGFWKTSAGESVWREIGMNRLVTAHNGYLEIYLDGGLIGLFLLGVMIFTTGLNAINKLVRGDSIGKLAVLFWVIILFNNVSESLFFIPGALWFTMLLVTMESPWKNSSMVHR